MNKSNINSKIKSLLNPYALGLGIIFMLTLWIIAPQGDTFWSIRLGEEIFQGKNPYVESWSWTADGNYYPNHEVLWEIIVYVLYLLGGKTLFVVYLAQAILLTATFALCLPTRESRQKLKLIPEVISASFILLLPAIYASRIGTLEVRAQTITFFFIALVIYLLRKETYWPIPIIFLFWANIHGGFLIGCLVLFFAFLFSVIFALIEKNAHSKKRAKKLLLTGIFSFIATFCTPLTWKLWVYVIESSDKIESNIVEFQHAWSFSFYFTTFTLIALPFILIALPYFRVFLKDWDTALSLFLTIISIPLGLFIARFIPLFLIAAGPLIISSTMLLKNENAIRAKLYSFIELRKKTIAVLLLSTIPISLAISFHKINNNLDLKISNKAIVALEACPGNVYNDYNSGAFLIWWVPDHKVYLDSRYDPYPKNVRSSTDFYPGVDWRGLVEVENVSCAFAGRWSPTDFTLHSEKWPVEYKNEDWILYRNPNYRPDSILTLNPGVMY